MAKECYITGKKSMTGNNRSHALNATKKKWKANLQKVKIIDANGEVKKVYLSARAMKSNKVKRA